MSIKEVDYIRRDSYDSVEDLVRVHRDVNRDFYSFELFHPFKLVFEGHDSILFLPGDRVAHYGRHAIFLACLNSSTHSVEIGKNREATITTRDLAEPSVFNTWIQAALQLELNRD